MVSKLDGLLAEIVRASDAGLSRAKMVAKFVGKAGPGAGARESELRDKLAALVGEGAVRGPFQTGRTRLYFVAGRGPSIESVSDAVERLVLQCGVKLASKAALEKKITGLNRRYFDDAVANSVARGAIAELVCGRLKYYLHRDVAAQRLGLEAAPAAPGVLRLADLLASYRRLKAEQGGLAAVKIYDLIEASRASKQDVHRVLIEEAKAGRVTIHPTTSVELPREVIDAGLRLPGFAEPFITVVVKGDR